MRTLSLRLTAAITGRRTKPPIPDEDLAAIKEQARQLLEQTTATAHEPPRPAAPTPRPVPRRTGEALGYGPTPPPVYDPGPYRIQPVAKYPPFGSKPTGERRPAPTVLPRFASPWDVAWDLLTDAERAWSSQP